MKTTVNIIPGRSNILDAFGMGESEFEKLSERQFELIEKCDDAATVAHQIFSEFDEWAILVLLAMEVVAKIKLADIYENLLGDRGK